MIDAMAPKDDLRRWLSKDWTHVAILYGIILLTLSLVVQVVATIFLSSLS